MSSNFKMKSQFFVLYVVKLTQKNMKKTEPKKSKMHLENLFDAVKSGNIAEVEKALTEEKFNAGTYYGARAIVLAAKQKNTEILELLLKNSENINRESFWSRTSWSVLSNVIDTENIETLNLLLKYGIATDKELLRSYVVSTENKEIEQLMIAQGFRHRKKNSPISNNNDDNTKKTEHWLEEDGNFIPEKLSKDNIFIQYAKEGKISKLKELLDKEVSDKAVFSAVDAALEKDKWETVMVLLDYYQNKDVEIYTECLKKIFLKASYTADIEKVKFYLEKLIENIVGVLTDETGKSSLEIAMENNPEDIIKILSNYGFHENSLRHAYGCLMECKGLTL